MKKAIKLSAVVLVVLSLSLTACTKNQEQVNGTVVVKDTLPYNPRP